MTWDFALLTASSLRLQNFPSILAAIALTSWQHHINGVQILGSCPVPDKTSPWDWWCQAKTTWDHQKQGDVWCSVEGLIDAKATVAVLAPTGSTGRGGYHGLEKRGERSKTVSAGCAIPDVQKHVIAYRSMPMHIRWHHYSPFHAFPIQRHQNLKTNRGQGFLDNNVVNELSTARWCGKWKTRQTIPNRCVVCQRQSTQTLA